MKKNFNYEDVPKNYLYCKNTECAHSSNCLRFNAALYVDERTPYFLVVNLNYIINQKECPYFRSNNLKRFALGITHLFSNLSHIKALKIKGILYEYFKRNTFYRIKNKQRLINPKEQAFVLQTFINEGITENPVFDEYFEKYDW